MCVGAHGARGAVRICYEACYPPETFNVGPSQQTRITVYIAQVGNGWVRRNSYVDLHFKKALQLAATLDRRWLVVACSTNSSMVISQCGTVVRQLGVGKGLLMVRDPCHEVALGSM
jgi:apolipoprotein N-acyltransferase